MLKPAYGTVSMLLAILILGLLAVMTVPILKTTSGAGVGKSSIKQESVEEKTQEMIDEIQKMREQSNNYYTEQE